MNQKKYTIGIITTIIVLIMITISASAINDHTLQKADKIIYTDNLEKYLTRAEIIHTQIPSQISYQKNTTQRIAIFRKLQEEIDNATEGSVINLNPSYVYYGNAIVNKSLTINGNGATITGGINGIEVNGTYEVNILNSNIIDAIDNGIYYHNGAYGRIENNTIINNTNGIYIHKSNNTIIINNTANSNNKSIYILLSNNNTINSNIVSNNQHGIFLESSSNNTIIDNNISNNNYGILFKLSINNKIIGSNALNNQYGISLDTSSNNTINNNNLSNNNDGIYLLYSDNNTILYNNALNNQYGIFIDISNNNIINSNDANFNNYNGISLLQSSDTTIISNNASSNQYGIYLQQSSKNKIVNNTANFNNYNGISLLQSSNNTINSINALNNQYGIYLQQSSDNTINSNNASNNQYGIYLQQASNNTISFNNTINNNSDYGIYLLESFEINISNNLIINNYGDGIYSKFSSNISIYYNSIYSNEGYGVYNDGSINVNASNNWWGGVPNVDGEEVGVDIIYVPYSCNSSFDAYCAELPPPNTILEPKNNSVFAGEQIITFKAFFNGIPYNYNWTSSLDGNIGTGFYFDYSDLSIGNHTITLNVTSNGNLIGTDTVEITITPSSDWIVTKSEFYKDKVMVLNKNLIIKKGGVLSFDKVTLKIESKYDGQYRIEVKEGGAFYINNSIITSGGYIIGDLNGNGRVDIGDAAKVAYMAVGKVQVDLRADFDGNEKVDMDDANKIALYLIGKIDSLGSTSESKNYLFWINKGSKFEVQNSELHNIGYKSKNPKNNGLWINANNTLIKNNTISKNYYGIYLKSSNNNIINNIINLNDKHGIYLDSFSTGNTIIDNNIHSNLEKGIFLYSSSKNQITNNTASNNEYGILLEYSDSNQIINNEVYSNNKDGIYLVSSSNNAIINNTANSNNWDGIYLFSSSARNQIINNTANSNNWYGILLDSYSNNNTISNNIANSNSNGIFLYFYSDSNQIINNNVSSNNWHGIELYSSNENQITNNIANTYNFVGIKLSNSYNNQITNNTANLNTFMGILLSNSHNNQLTTNTANYNKWNGIELEYSNENQITNNTVNSNYRYGIYLVSSSINKIYENTVFSNYWDGIYISGYNNTLINNTANSNSMHGIFIEAQNSTLIGNLANLNKNNGIYLEGDSSIINDNVALNNLDYDILVKGSYNNIKKNIACGVQGLGTNTLENNKCFLEPKEWIVGDIKPCIKESNFTIYGYRDNLELRKLDLPEFINITFTLPKTLNKWETLNFTLSLNTTALIPASYAHEPIIETSDLNFKFPVSFNVLPLSSNCDIKVKDRDTNISLKNASIYVQEMDITKKTDLNGIVILQAIEPSVYTIKIEAPGYQSKIETINLESGVNKSKEILLSKAIATLSGIVTYNNTPLPNITLSINPPGGGTIVEYEILNRFNNTVMIKIYPEVEDIKVELRDENNTLIPNAIDYTDKRGVVWLGFNKTEKDIWIYIEDKKATQLIPFGRKKVETNIVLPVKKAIATALTNGSGYFSLDLSLGNYELEIEEEGYAKYKEGFNLTEEGLIKNISLSKVVELLIVTNKSALQNKYGDISELINRLEKIKGSKIEFIDPNNYVSAKDQINKLIKESKAKNLLIVGGDSIIPFYRIEDPIPNKNSEFHESGNIAWNLLYPQYNTNGKVLTDDPYTDVIEGSDLRADIPVGRILGVTLDDLINLINNSIKKNKVTLLSGTLVYGEDWTRDVADLIEGYLIKESVSTLYWGETTINPSNTLNLINSDIVFSATHTVPETWYTGAIGANSTFINAEDLNIYLNSDNNPLVITLGCHGALVLENMDLNDSLTLGFIHHGASGFIGNTGFGIVSNEIKYSEAFYSELIRRMLEPDLTIGEVLLNTKQATPFKNPLDKKINLETVFYGNPKNKLNSGTNKIKGLQSKKLYLKASESNYFKESPFHRVIEETDLSTTYTGKMISILEINKEFINNPENTYIINNTIVPYVALSDLKLSENVVIKEIKINHKLSKTELIKLDLPKLDLVGWLPNNTTYKDNISNETIVLNPNWTNIIWETLPEYEGGKLLKTKFIPLKPYNSTHYELYTKVWLEATYTKSLIQISELNISDNIMKVTLANQAQNPENIKINLVLKRTNEEIVDTYTNYLDINATSLASTEFTLNLESGSYIAYIEVIDAKNNILDSKEKWFEVL